MVPYNSGPLLAFFMAFSNQTTFSREKEIKQNKRISSTCRGSPFSFMIILPFSKREREETSRDNNSASTRTGGKSSYHYAWASGRGHGHYISEASRCPKPSKIFLSSSASSCLNFEPATHLPCRCYAITASLYIQQAGLVIS